MLPPSSPPHSLRRSASLSSQLVSQCVRGRPGEEEVQQQQQQHECEGDVEAGRLPGTFHCLQEVQDTGVTPIPSLASPRALTPLVLLPLQESVSAREKLQSSLKRKLKTSLGVRLGGELGILNILLVFD